jgi:hypothetical protein
MKNEMMHLLTSDTSWSAVLAEIAVQPLFHEYSGAFLLIIAGISFLSLADLRLYRNVKV